MVRVAKCLLYMINFQQLTSSNIKPLSLRFCSPPFADIKLLEHKLGNPHNILIFPLTIITSLNFLNNR